MSYTPKSIWMSIWENCTQDLTFNVACVSHCSRVIMPHTGTLRPTSKLDMFVIFAGTDLNIQVQLKPTWKLTPKRSLYLVHGEDVKKNLQVKSPCGNTCRLMAWTHGSVRNVTKRLTLSAIFTNMKKEFMVLVGEHCVELFGNGHTSEPNTSAAALSVKKLSSSVKTSLSTHASSPAEISPNLNRKMMTLRTTMENMNKNKVLLKTKKLKRLTMFKLTEICWVHFFMSYIST